MTSKKDGKQKCYMTENRAGSGKNIITDRKTLAAAGAVLLSTTLCLGRAGWHPAEAAGHTQQTEPETEPVRTTAGRRTELNGQITPSGKEETVYVTAEADGTVKQVIVSEWLKNAGENVTLDDMTNLLHIENIKGDETFSQNGDGSLTWAAGGNDIYYQGESNETLPVSMKITYWLDGKKISPEELAGKSGRVVIHIDYENHTFEEVEIDGKKEQICTPFMMLTGMILPEDTFRNVEVDNGKLLSDGNNQIVVGTAFPGLSKSLKLNDMEGFEDTNLPDYVEIRADVEDFSLAMTATVASNGALSRFDVDETFDVDALQESLDELTDASGQLVDGSGELSDGVQTLWDAITEYTDGMNSADEGAGKLLEGINTLEEKKGELINGVTELREGMETLEGGAADLKNGVDQYTDGVGTLAQGAADLDSGAGQVKDGIDALNQNKGALVDGVASLASGSQELTAGAGSLSDGIKAYTDGTAQLAAGISAMKTQVTEAAGGLSAGTAPAVSQDASAMTDALTALQGALAETQTNVAALAEALQNSGSEDAGYQTEYTTDLETVKGDLTAYIDAMEDLDDEKKADLKAQIQAMEVNVEVQVTPVGDTPQAPDLSALQNSLKQAGEAAASVGQAAQSGQETMQAVMTAVQTQQQALTGMVGQLIQGLEELESGSQALCAQNEALVQGAQALVQGAGQVSAGAGELAQGAGTLSDGIQQLADGASSLKDGTSRLNAGAAELQSNSGALREGSEKLRNGSSDLLAGGRKLEDGAGALGDGVRQLADGAAELKEGTGQLNSAGTELKDGVVTLKDGAAELRDGMETFDEEGVHKLSDRVEDDLLVLLDRFKAAADADKQYTSFGGRMEQVEGSVKFIIETEGIGK